MPDELNDLSGPFNPDFTFDMFSKEFLLKLFQGWQYAWLHMSESWYNRSRRGLVSRRRTIARYIPG